MALIHDIARLAHSGTPREDIASAVLISRQTLDWLMDSDSFLIVMEQMHGSADKGTDHVD
jgi:orotate phosphoribosyltransferase-like protein